MDKAGLTRPVATPRAFFVPNQELARKREEKSRKDKNRVASYNAAQRQNQNVRKPWVAHINAELNTDSEAAAVASATATAAASPTPAAATAAGGAATAQAAAAGGAAVAAGGLVAAMAAAPPPPAASGGVGVVPTAGVVPRGSQPAIASAAAAQPAPPATA